MKTVIGFDTSNYTTSIAAFDGLHAHNCSRLLDVRPGELGLRQSDALFSHVKRLPEQAEALFAQLDGCDIAAVGASTRPRAVEGSYMPCFLAGESQARVLAQALGVPFYAVSHQQGHIAAALYSAGRMELMHRRHLAWHLSGGTTELLLVEPDGQNVKAEKIGGTTDLSAGQLIDRTGKRLGLPFPAGKEIDRLSRDADVKGFRVRRDGLSFSLSGMENKISAYIENGASAQEVSCAALRTVIGAVRDVTEAALRRFPDCTVVFSGGVTSNAMLRSAMQDLDAVFAKPEYATDNALGVAVLTWGMEDGTADTDRHGAE